jgi:hypothetical protein
MLEGYHPDDPAVRVFTYQADPAGRTPEQIAEEAFASCNGHPHDAHGEDLARRYYERELRRVPTALGRRPAYCGAVVREPVHRLRRPGSGRRGSAGCPAGLVRRVRPARCRRAGRPLPARPQPKSTSSGIPKGTSKGT